MTAPPATPQTTCSSLADAFVVNVSCLSWTLPTSIIHVYISTHVYPPSLFHLVMSILHVYLPDHIYLPCLFIYPYIYHPCLFISPYISSTSIDLPISIIHVYLSGHIYPSCLFTWPYISSTSIDLPVNISSMSIYLAIYILHAYLPAHIYHPHLCICPHLSSTPIYLPMSIIHVPLSHSSTIWSIQQALTSWLQITSLLSKVSCIRLLIKLLPMSLDHATYILPKSLIKT